MNRRITTLISSRRFLWGFVLFSLMLGGTLGLGSGHAAAAVNCSDQGHNVTFTVDSENVATNTLIGGASIREGRTQAPINCPNGPGNPSNFYVDSTSNAPGHHDNTATTSGSVRTIFWDSCWNSPPTFSQSPPAGDTFAYADVSALTSTGYQTIKVTDGSTQGFQSAITQLWTPEYQNDGSGIYIDLFYNVPPPGWQLAGGTAVAISTSSSAPFTNFVVNSGPPSPDDPATYSWQVLGEFVPKGQSVASQSSNKWSPSGLPSGSASGVAYNAYNPAASTNTYTFSGANDGDQYCEEIKFTPAKYNTSAPGYSLPACTTLSANKQIENGACTIVSPANGITATLGSNVTIDARVTNTGNVNWGSSVGVRQSAPTLQDDYPIGATQIVLPAPNPGSTTDFNFVNSGPAAPSVVTYSYELIQDGYVVSNPPIMCSTTINWIQPPPYLGTNPADCTQVSGWAAQDLGTNTDNITVSVYVDGPLGTGWKMPTTSNYGVPYNGGLPPGHNPNWSLSLTGTLTDSNGGTHVLDDGSPHSLYVYATNGAGETVGYGSASNVYGNDPVTMPACAPFTTNGSTGLTLLDATGNQNNENPTSYNTSSGVNIAYGSGVLSTFNPPIAMTCSVGVTKPVGQPADPNKTCDGKFNRVASAPIIGPTGTASPPGGNQYCPTLTTQYSSGIVDSSGNVYNGAGPGTFTGGCGTVVNRPFYKVYNSGVVAGGDFAATNPSCIGPAANSGYLVGWNDDSGTYPPYADFGSGTGLSSLALVADSGFASNQQPSSNSAYKTSPTNLAFANTAYTTGSGTDGPGYSPLLGGGFAPGAGNCLFSVSRPSGVAAGTSTVTKAGHTYTTNIASTNTKIAATTVGTNTSDSVFVSGAGGSEADAYISGNIVYAGDNSPNSGVNATWTSPNHVPSYVLDVKGGNIYIAPGVKELDGTYIAQPDAAGHGGKIYTCSSISGSTYTPVANANLYGSCATQLTVFGSFTAEQVNMQRTFGSLRDEAPFRAVTGASTASTPGVSVPLQWSSSGTIAGSACTQVDEPSEPAAHAWTDNYLCVPSADSSVKLSYTCSEWVGNPGNCNSGSQLPYCTAGIGSVIDAAPWGYPGANAPGQYYWEDNYICSNVPIQFVTSNANGPPTVAGYTCTATGEPSDTDGKNVWQHAYVCVQTYVPSTGNQLNGRDYSSCTPATAGWPCEINGNSVVNAINYSVAYPFNGLSTSGNYNLTLNYDNDGTPWPPPNPPSPNTPYHYNVNVSVNGTQVVSNWKLSTSSGAQTASVNLGTLPANATITLTWNNNGWIDSNGNPQGVQTPYDPNLEINSVKINAPAALKTITAPGQCSNSGGGWLAGSGGPANHTCAAEVFYLSPELYLSNPYVQLPNNGALQYQAVTGLPPVL